MIGASDMMDPEINAFIPSVVRQINRFAYLKIVGGWETGKTATPLDTERELEVIIALAFGNDKDDLEKKDLREIDSSINWALPHALEGPDVWELWG